MNDSKNGYSDCTSTQSKVDMVDDIYSEAVPVFDRWEEFKLKPELLEAIFSAGFETPSFIQKTAIMPIINGRDIRAQAQSGTGKTAAFGIGALQRLNSSKEIQVLILVNTREMANQNALRISSLALNMEVQICVLAGGIDVSGNMEELSMRPEIVVGTPGRVLHMITNRLLDTSKIHLLIIDEADEMLSRGFEEQLRDIFAFLPEDMQVAMFSATWEERECKIANKILKAPVTIDLRADEQTLKGIDQFYVNLGERPHDQKNKDSVKVEVFMDLYKNNTFGQCVMFVNTKHKAKYVYESLKRKDIPVDIMHSDLGKEERIEVLKKFSEGNSRLLIATGLIGRGIDIQQLSLVINFDLPKFSDTDGVFKTDKSSYIHRIGRAGRFGRKGKALNIIYSDEMEHLNEIMEHYRTSIMPLPKNYDLS